MTVFKAEIPYRVTHQDANRIEMNMTLLPEWQYFDGHFPSVGILPGVAQIHWVMIVASRYFNRKFEVDSLSQIKFKKPLLVHDEITLSLEYAEDLNRLSYSYKKNGKETSEGKIKCR